MPPAAPPPMPDKVDIYRPFGAATPKYRDVPCRFVPRFWAGRGAYVSSDYIQYDCWFDFAKSQLVEDLTSRAAGTTIFSFSDGDGIQFRIQGDIYTYVVVWSEPRYTNTPAEYRRAYCRRDTEVFASSSGGVFGGSRSTRTPPPSAPADPDVQVVATADGLGDHMLLLTTTQGLRQDGKKVTLIPKHQFLWPWLERFDAYDELSATPKDGVATVRPHDTYTRQINERTAKPRATYYAEAANTQPQLPKLKPLSPAMLQWRQDWAGCVALAPWAAWEDRAMPTPQWVALIDQLRSRGYRPVVLDMASDRNQVFRCDKLMGGTAEQVVALLTAASACIGNDSGIAHVAGLCGTPTVALSSCIPADRIYGVYPTVHAVETNALQPGCHWDRQECLKRHGSATKCHGLDAIPPQDIVAHLDQLVHRGVWSHTLQSADKLAFLSRAVRETKDIPGDMAEFGTFKGGTARLMKLESKSKLLHIYDNGAGGLPADDTRGVHRKGEFASPESEMRAFVGEDNSEIHLGVFPETAKSESRFAICHIDFDTYDSTLAALLYAWPRLNPGGCLVLDDVAWTNTPGVLAAVKAAGLADRMEPLAKYQVKIVKPK